MGADWNFADHFRLGAGGGYAESGVDLARTENKISFWGASLYDAWLNENFSLGLDSTFAATSNNITQDLPSSLEMRNLTGELTTRTLSAE